MVKKVYSFSGEKLRAQLLADAEHLKIAKGWAEDIADATVKAAQEYADSHVIVSEMDMKVVVGKKLKELHPDLAFLFMDYDKII